MRFRSRLLVFIGLWLLAGVAFEVFLQPEGLTETAETETHQRLMWPLVAPLMVAIGLAEDTDWSAFPTGGAMLASVGCLGLQALCTLLCKNWRLLLVAGFVQTLLLASGVVGLIHLSGLPSGG